MSLLQTVPKHQSCAARSMSDTDWRNLLWRSRPAEGSYHMLSSRRHKGPRLSDYKQFHSNRRFFPAFCTCSFFQLILPVPTGFRNYFWHCPHTWTTPLLHLQYVRRRHFLWNAISAICSPELSPDSSECRRNLLIFLEKPLDIFHMLHYYKNVSCISCDPL